MSRFRKTLSRRTFIAGGAALAAGAAQVAEAKGQWGIGLGQRPEPPSGAEVLNPRLRVPVSFFIDDSTCLVNMGCFCMPQFAEAWPQRKIYHKPWKTWPREIPDSFVRKFALWCAEQGVKGKYSLVPYPALVGWLDRELPGWSRRELLDSLKLVREIMLPHWDIHPEMITHTRVIDIRTGRPMEEISSATMENSYPQTHKSVDQLASYLAYALRILKNCGIPCEGITTPGGFGNRVKTNLSLAVCQAVREVFGAEIPHYFKYVADPGESTEPVVEQVRGLGKGTPDLTVNVPAGTGDWFGNWDGDRTPEPWRYARDDASSGRMVELIEQGKPAVMLCHWPGLYSHGTEAGFEACKRVISAINGGFRNKIIWMKISEIARYWAAKELTEIRSGPEGVSFKSPFAAPDFTVKVPRARPGPVRLRVGRKVRALREVRRAVDLRSGTFLVRRDSVVACFDLPRGESRLEM